jgi:hypothetical protein
MRSLKTSDLFSLTRIIKKMNIKDEIKGLITDVSSLSDADKANALQKVQMELVLLFIENIGNAEKEIYKLLADMNDCTAKDIENQSPLKTIEMIQAISNDEELVNFLKVALK